MFDCLWVWFLAIILSLLPPRLQTLVHWDCLYRNFDKITAFYSIPIERYNIVDFCCRGYRKMVARRSVICRIKLCEPIYLNSVVHFHSQMVLANGSSFVDSFHERNRNHSDNLISLLLLDCNIC